MLWSLGSFGYLPKEAGGLVDVIRRIAGSEKASEDKILRSPLVAGV